MEDYIKKPLLLIVLGGFTTLFSFIVIWSSWYITPEGSVDIVKRFSKAEYVAEPGLNFKIPLIDTTTTIEVRTIKNTESMEASTSEQMPVSVTASMNWTVSKSQVLHLFKDYGSLEQFESRVIDPRFRAIVKEVMAKYKAEDTIGKRDEVTTKIRDAITASMKDLPIDISAINIENIVLPVNYLKSIETKQTEKNLADAEVFKLEKQNLEAQRAVNVAKAEAESTLLRAKADAEAITLRGQAEASAIHAKAKALDNQPLIVELTKATQWDGKLPTTALSSGMPIIMDIKK